MTDYIISQFQRVEPLDEYGASMQVTSMAGKTNWLNLDAVAYGKVKHALIDQECRQNGQREEDPIDKIVNRLVRSDVLANASMMVHQLSQADAGEALGVPIDDLLNCCTAPDWSEAPAGYGVYWVESEQDYYATGGDNDLYACGFDTEREAIQAAWEDAGDEPDQIEALEHWIVSDWLAEKLEAAGALVARDILGFDIWGRTETGQSLTMDSDLIAVAKDLARQ